MLLVAYFDYIDFDKVGVLLLAWCMSLFRQRFAINSAILSDYNFTSVACGKSASSLTLSCQTSQALSRNSGVPPGLFLFHEWKRFFAGLLVNNTETYL
jgi:hypothetical protein